MFLEKSKNRYLSAFSLLSRIPLKARFTFDAGGLDLYMPLIGPLAACFYLFPFLLLQHTGVHAMLVSIIALAIYYYAFNLFHFDGLLDTADAFLGYNTPEKTKSILKDSGIGVYAFFTGILYLAVKILLLKDLSTLPLPYVFLIFGFSVSGRAASAFIPCFFQVSNASRLGRMTKSNHGGRVLTGTLLGLLFPFLGFFMINSIQPLALPGMPGSIILILSLCLLVPFISISVTVIWLGHLYTKRVGGYTGDCLGAAVEIAELLHIVLFLVCLGFIYA